MSDTLKVWGSIPTADHVARVSFHVAFACPAVMGTWWNDTIAS